MDPSRPDFAHVPVMLDEIVELFAEVPAGVFADLTIGGAGHSWAVLERNPGLVLHGFDQDPTAVDAADARLADFGSRATIHHSRFDRASSILRDEGVAQLSAFLMDLGVSSPQLDRPERGFSYRHDGPLDMRMNPGSDLTADRVVNDYPIAELIDVLRSYGDERHAVRIARAIERARPIEGTARLAEVVANAVPAAARRTGGHPATRSFQAIRIEVNAELSILGAALDQMIEMLAPGGLGLVLTYHSGEDRIAKDRLRAAITSDDLPGLPRTSAYDWAWRGARTPGSRETDANPRARSARLRGIRRVGDR